MKLESLMSIFFIGSLIGCSNKPNIESNVNIEEKALVVFESNPINRTECYPGIRYKLFIFSDGTVVFDGINLIIGKVEKSYLTKVELDNLLSEINKSRFWDLTDTYDSDGKDCGSSATDSPVFKITVNANNKSKTITHYTGCTNPNIPDALFELEYRIQKIAGDKQWLGDYWNIREADGSGNRMRPFGQ